MSSAVDTSTKDAWGVVAGAPARLLRLEGAALLTSSLLAYTTTGRPWWLVPLTLALSLLVCQPPVTTTVRSTVAPCWR
jgi:hypothetical protein